MTTKFLEFTDRETGLPISLRECLIQRFDSKGDVGTNVIYMYRHIEVKESYEEVKRIVEGTTGELPKNSSSMGIRLRRLRTNKGWTQRELAEKLSGKTSGNCKISTWENGFSKPDLNTLEKLAKVFGVTVDEILMG